MIDLVGNSVAYGQQLTPATPVAAAPVAPAATTAAQNVDALNHLPHGIRGLAEYPMIVIPFWVIALVSVILLGAISWGLWHWWRKKHPKVSIEKRIHPLDQLRDQIEKLRPPEPFLGKAQEDYFYNLSMSLRQFIEELLKIPATDRTLKELREPLRQMLPLSRERVGEVIGFLERADMIKFAQAPTSFEEALRCHDDVKLWVVYLLPRELDLAAGSADQSPPINPQFEEVGHRI
jgi:hypothetical protein